GKRGPSEGVPRRANQVDAPRRRRSILTPSAHRAPAHSGRATGREEGNPPRVPLPKQEAPSMGQERFADVVERFTNGLAAGATAATPEVVKQWQEELDRNVRRLTNLGKLATAAEPRTGQTAREEIYKRN